MDRVDIFIANLYHSVENGSTDTFRETALRALGDLVDFDGALWGSGNYTSNVFHSVVTLGVEAGYPQALERTQGINPILPALLDNVGQAVDMRSVIGDSAFLQSPVYRRCFSRYGIERIVSYLAYDRRSHLYTLLSLYRFDADRPFTEDERCLFERAAYHLVAAAGHAFFLHMATGARPQSPAVHAAVCDDHGLLYQAQPSFVDLIEDRFESWSYERLPFTLPAPGETRVTHGLCIEVEALGDLFCVRIRREGPIDCLRGRDQEIVAGVCRGMTFKDIGRELELAPSTVSNRLYRVYRQLGVTNRSSLVRLVHRSA
ncbi:helix-turn-helix transcriptional regulator [Endozoicomonas sp. G2_2]|uniref:helix-turn-helix transcriptional regulator n=1 Tax=Endozoicomonas sp. G2_2 TaxID=2821092 RepID=UPI001AD96732|nr:helix-turn-helix transcriptional regulator [Endozoicomonas sp. G2_2]MBO9469174.1 helix-turn-helix transcriptional regulator [Endozoicomonas sp. G2_2]